MKVNEKIFIAGHRGLVGSAIVRNLKKNGFENLIYESRDVLDLTNQDQVKSYFGKEKPAYVFLAAAKVGGIYANNTYPAEFLYQNLMIQNNVLNSAYQNDVKKLLFLGSSCIYPKFAPQPMKEEYMLTGALEPTNEAYAIAKIAGLKTAEYFYKQYGISFISAMPTNLYGQGDNYDLQNSHVLPALIRKFHEAKLENKPSVEIWGTGQPKREFLYVDDLAEACLFLMLNYNDVEFVNVGTGEDISISDLAYIIKEIVGYSGKVEFNRDKPDGTPRKLLDVSKLNTLGWKAKVTLHEGIKMTYDHYKNGL